MDTQYAAENIVKQYHMGLITQTEMDHKLENETASLHGDYNTKTGKYTGYDYATQKWVEFNL